MKLRMILLILILLFASSCGRILPTSAPPESSVPFSYEGDAHATRPGPDPVVAASTAHAPGHTTEPGTEQGTERGTENVNTEPAGTEGPSSPVPEESTGAVSASEETVPQTVPGSTEDPDPAENYTARFMGRLMADDIAALNARTLSDPASGLYDVLGECTLTNEDVLNRILSYTCPDTPWLGDAPFTDELKETLYQNTNRGVLEEKIRNAPGTRAAVRYAILLTNADVRTLPTVSRATASGQPTDHDRMQETKLPYASGVIILHESSDGQWYFVQGEYYYGWILKSGAAEVDRASYLRYLSSDQFAVSLAVSGDEPWQRLGVVVPYSEWKDGTVTLLLPARNELGNFRTEERMLPDTWWSPGFRPYSPEEAVQRLLDLIGVSYGWGDELSRYDCSSTVGGICRIFGIWLPRNTSAMTAFGGTVQDVTALSHDERKAVIKAHPGALLLFPGHVMMSAGDGTSFDMDVPALHNTTGFYRADDGTGYESVRAVVLTDLERIYSGAGVPYTDIVRYVIYYR